jgi:hypothetical protein
MKWILLATWIPVILTHSIANAEPDVVTKYLMDEPVSMMDFGIFRLDQRVREVMASDHNAIGAARYEWDKNKIILTGFSSDKGIKTIQDAQNKCKEMVNSLRFVLGVNADTGKSIFGTSSMIDQYFSHKGYKTAAEPKGFSENLVKLVDIQGIATTQDGEKLECHGPLMGTVIYFSR